MEVSSHAVDNYIERVMCINHETVDTRTRSYAENMILSAALNPERIHHEEDESCPIHIRGDVAVPVKVKREGDGRVVPTTYHSDTFSTCDES